jgi:hypothetical protein
MYVVEQLLNLVTENTMAALQSKNEMLVMVLTDLTAICEKLTESSAVPEELRRKAEEFVAEFNMLLPSKGKGAEYAHFQGEALIIRMARFLPRLIDVQAAPAVSNY